MNVKENHRLMMELHTRGFKVEPHFNSSLGRYSDVLISVNDMLCYILQIYEGPRILSDSVVKDTDFIIATTQVGTNTSFYIIPSDFIEKTKDSYGLPYADYKDAWDYLTL